MKEDTVPHALTQDTHCVQINQCGEIITLVS